MSEQQVPAPSPQPPALPTAGGVSSTGLSERTAAGLSYLAGWVTGLIFFLMEKSSAYVRFHAAQSLVVFGILALAHMFLVPISFGLWGLLSVANLALWIYCLVMAFSGKPFRLPLAADLADKLIGSKPLEGPPAPAVSPGVGGQPVTASGGSNTAMIMGIVAASFLLLCGGAIAVGIFAFKALSPIQLDKEGITLKGPDGKIRIESPSEEELRELEKPRPVRASMDRIRELLPETVGEWRRQDDYRIQKMGEENNEVTHAVARYRRRDETIEVQLWGGTGLGLWAASWIGLAQVEEKDMYVRKLTLAGFNGKEQVHKKERKAAIWLRVGKFAILAQQGRTDGPESVREFLQTMDLEAISKTD